MREKGILRFHRSASSRESTHNNKCRIRATTTLKRSQGGRQVRARKVWGRGDREAREQVQFIVQAHRQLIKQLSVKGPQLSLINHSLRIIAAEQIRKM